MNPLDAVPPEEREICPNCGLLSLIEYEPLDVENNDGYGKLCINKSCKYHKKC